MAPSEVGSTGAPVVTAPATDDRLPAMDVPNVVKIIEPSVVTVVSEIDEGFGTGQAPEPALSSRLMAKFSRTRMLSTARRR